jgi:hypothetical protein
MRDLTPEELDKAYEAKEEFKENLAKIAAKALWFFDDEAQPYVTLMLSDATSLHSPLTADRIQELIRRRRLLKP